MQLRHWQHQAVTHCLSRFRDGQAHFLCLATPGAGKTYMASTVAQKLLECGEVDFVFCFSPSINISNSFQATLESVLGHRLDGRLGAKGNVLTYQSMLKLDQSYWSLLKSHRTLVIFDEIHHCAGDNLGNANAWGQKIIQYIQGKATFTLALTGTPWRSDRIPIALTSYCREGKVHCDFIYGLDQAIEDGVCRSPKITAIDNDKISVKRNNTETVYSSFDNLLKNSNCTYQQLLENRVLIRYLIELSQKSLHSIRKSNPNAGGLIVAASVEHALLISTILESTSHETPTVVTYMHEDSQTAIQQFRDSNTQWIVSVGMISEGTDIPRLQVCCHLTRVKTELYFRQVLGRVLRVQKCSREAAIFIMPAEPKLIEYAQRVAEDIPDTNAISIRFMEEGVIPELTQQNEQAISPIKEENFTEESAFELGFINSPPVTISINEPHNENAAIPFNSLAETYESSIGLFGRFKKRMISLSAVVG